MGKANQGETGTNGSYRGYRARLGARFGGAAAIGGAVLAGMIMFLAPAASAMISNGTNTAPYTGVHLSIGKSVSFSGCATAHGKKGAFAPSTGIGMMKASAAAKQCSFTSFGSYGDGSSFSELALAAGVTSTASYTVDVNVTYTSASSGSLVYGSCTAATVAGTSFTYSSCYASASWEFFFDAWMVDATNGTYYYGSFVYSYNDSYVSDYSYCYSGSCYWSNYTASYGYGSASGANDLFIYPYYSLDSTHNYWIFVETEAFAYADVGGYGNQAGAGAWIGGASATASTNLASLGNNWDLNFVSIT